jgi:hypothetical protein
MKGDDAQPVLAVHKSLYKIVQFHMKKRNEQKLFLRPILLFLLFLLAQWRGRLLLLLPAQASPARAARLPARRAQSTRAPRWTAPAAPGRRCRRRAGCAAWAAGSTPPPRARRGCAAARAPSPARCPRQIPAKTYPRRNTLIKKLFFLVFFLFTRGGRVLRRRCWTRSRASRRRLPGARRRDRGWRWQRRGRAWRGGRDSEGSKATRARRAAAARREHEQQDRAEAPQDCRSRPHQHRPRAVLQTR